MFPIQAWAGGPDIEKHAESIVSIVQQGRAPWRGDVGKQRRDVCAWPMWIVRKVVR